MLKSKKYAPKKSVSNKKFSFGPVDKGNKERKILYDSTWRKYRVIFLSINKECYACGEAATLIDHIVAHKNDEVLFESTTNHLPMCSKCHSQVTNLFDKHDTPKTQEKIAWINELRLARGIKVSVKVLPRYGKKQT
jgi:hypothetical protein